jgi:hypothetical protein
MYGVIGFIFEGLDIMPNTLPFERRKKIQKDVNTSNGGLLILKLTIKQYTKSMHMDL